MSSMGDLSDNKQDKDKPSGFLPEAGKLATKVTRLWGVLVNPPVSVTDVGKRRTAQLSASIALILTIVLLIGVAAALAYTPISSPSTLTQMGIILGLLIAYTLSRTRWFRVGPVIIVIALSISGYGLAFTNPSLTDLSFAGAIYSTIPLSMVIGSALLPLPAMIALVVVNFVVISFVPTWLPVVTFQRAGSDAGNILTIGVLLTIVIVFRNYLEQQRLKELRNVNFQLEEANQALNINRLSLENQVKERTSKLAGVAELNAERVRRLQQVAEITHLVATIQDIEQLLPRVTELISQSFGYYQVGIFLLDKFGEFAVLQAASSEGGKRMLARGHRLEVGEKGIVGYVASTGKPRIALDVDVDSVFFDNPDLPDTRSEIAFPLAVAGRTIGVLDLQSNQSGAFTEEDIAILTTLANQIAVTYQNSHLLSETNRAIRELQVAQQQYVKQTWGKVATERPQIGYRYQYGNLQPLSKDEASQNWNFLAEGNEIVSQSVEVDSTPVKVGDLIQEGGKLIVPIALRGQVIGLIDLEELTGTRQWSSDELKLVRAVADQVGLALENARLLDETQRRAERERLVSEITTKMRASNDPKAILETAVSELRNALRVKSVRVQIKSTAEQPQSNVDEITSMS